VLQRFIRRNLIIKVLEACSRFATQKGYLFAVFFSDPVISVVLEQRIIRGVAHLKRRHIRILKMCDVIATE
jgi:hypothetical protein